MRISKRLFIAGVFASVMTASPAFARDNDNNFKPQMGRMYFVVSDTGLPGLAEARPITGEQWDQLAFVDRGCQGQLKAQRPSGLSEVFHTALVGALGGGLGYGAGYGASGLGPVGKVAVLGSVVGAVGGIVGGIDGRARAKRYDMGQCMVLVVSMLQRRGFLTNVGILINSHAVNGKGISRPDNAGMADAAPTAASSTSDTTPVVIP